MNAEDVTKIIEESFQDVAYPGDDHLFGPVYDPDIPSFEILLLGRTWKEVLHILDRLEGSPFYFYQWLFTWLTSNALYYYAAAFLTISLDQKSDIVADCFFWQLEPCSEESHRFADFTHFVNLLSERQKHAIALTEDFCFSDKDTTLHLFWSRWL